MFSISQLFQISKLKSVLGHNKCEVLLDLCWKLGKGFNVVYLESFGLARINHFTVNSS